MFIKITHDHGDYYYLFYSSLPTKDPFLPVTTTGPSVTLCSPHSAPIALICFLVSFLFSISFYSCVFRWLWNVYSISVHVLIFLSYVSINNFSRTWWVNGRDRWWRSTDLTLLLLTLLISFMCSITHTLLPFVAIPWHFCVLY